MNRLRTLALTLGLSLSLVLGAVAAPQAANKKEKAAATTEKAGKKGAAADTKAAPAAAAKAAPGPGYVWANKDSKIFHREGSRFYGKTKNGEYMKESDAMAQGFREAGKTGDETKTAKAAPPAKADKKAAAAAAGKK